VFVSVKPLHVSVFFLDHLQGALLCALCRYYSSRCITKQFTSRSPTDKNTKHAQMTYTCGHTLRNNTDSTNANQQEEL